MNDELGNRMKEQFYLKRAELEQIYLRAEELDKICPDLRLSTFMVRKDGTKIPDKIYPSPTYVINLFQYMGTNITDYQLLNKSDYGYPNAEWTLYAVIYGTDTLRFKDLMERVGNFIDNKAFFELYTQMLPINGIIKPVKGKPMFSVNHNPLAVCVGIMVEFVKRYDKKQSARCNDFSINPVQLFLFMLREFGINPHRKRLWEYFVTWWGILGTTVTILGFWLFGWQQWDWWFFGLHPK
jgi:hypothetical protein